MPAGAHHVAGEQRDVVRHPLRDQAQGQVRVWHEHLLGLRALERAERLAVPEDAAFVALVEVAAAAEEAVATRRAVAAEHAVALGDLRHAVAGRDDRPDELVAEDEPLFHRDAAVVNVQVRATHAGGFDAHDRVALLEQLGLRALLHPDLAGRLESHRLHRTGTL
jgi:hypothetical protein